jgi:hypothetical protein
MRPRILVRAFWCLAVLASGACGRSQLTAEGVAGRSEAGGTSVTNAGMGGNGGRGSGAGGAGGRRPDGCLTRSDRIDGLSFDVTLANPDLGRNLALVFHFRKDGDDAELLVGSQGQAKVGRVRVGDEERWELVAPFELVDRAGLLTPDNGVVLTGFVACIEETELSATAEYTFISDSDDYDHRVERSALVSGARDLTPPKWVNPDTLHPLEWTRIEVSEPLGIESEALLLPSIGPTYPLEPLLENGATVAFAASTILPLGLEATPASRGTDLAGHSFLGGSFVVTTPFDPGLQAQDGFESGIRAVTFEGEPVETVQGGGALEGSRSARIRGGTDALFLLAREPSANRVRLDLKPEIHLLDVNDALVIRAGVVGGNEVATLRVPLSARTPDDARRSLELELPQGGTSVLVSVRAPFVEASVSVNVDAIIDRLRIE